jgi:threonine/homoserine/homoserine lactone efflux protein
LSGVLDPRRLVEFALVSLVIIIIPGPSVLFVVSRGVALGRRAAITTVLGNESGLFFQVVAVAFGLGALVERSLVVFNLIKLAGAAYLVYLGVQSVRHRRQLGAALEAKMAQKSNWRIYCDGVLVGATNPKSIILFTAILPQFISRSAGHVTLQLLLLGLMSVGIAVVCDSIWGLLAGGVSSWLGRSPKRLQALGGAGGLVMVVLGVRLALTGRKD